LHIENQTITRYLLGELLPDEQKHIEERYFSDPDLLDQVLGVEDDLIDAYVRQELGAQERERFENYFLASPDRRRRVEIADALRVCLGKPNVPIAAPNAATRSWGQSLSGLLRTEGPAMRFAFGAALLVAVVGGLWLFLENRRLRAQLDQVQLEKTRVEQQAPELQQQLAAQRTEKGEIVPKQKQKETAVKSPEQEPASGAPSTSRPVVASFVLTPGLTRDVEDVNKLVIPRSAQFVKLRLSLESQSEYVKYRASLQRVGAGEIWRYTFLKSTAGGSKESLTIKLPVNLFVGGEYLLTLTGTTATGESKIAGDYPFSVVKQ